MKSTSLVKTKKNAGIVSLDEKIDKVLQLFQMKIEYEIEILKRQAVGQPELIARPLNEPEKPVINSLIKIPELNRKEINIPPLAYEKLKMLTRCYIVSTIDPPRKTETVQSLINMLHIIYHLGGEAFVEQLFSCENLIPITGYRYLKRLRTEGLIERSAVYAGTAYRLTPAGRKFIQGEIKNKEQLQEALPKQTA